MEEKIEHVQENKMGVMPVGNPSPHCFKRAHPLRVRMT